jgi:hypothetical protein
MRAVSIGANPTANTLTTLYTVPKGYYAKIVSLIATNQSASNKHVTFDWVDSSASATYSVVYQYAVTSKSLNDFVSSYIVLEEDDILKVTTESASTFAVAVTLEIEGNQRA